MILLCVKQIVFLIYVRMLVPLNMMGGIIQLYVQFVWGCGQEEELNCHYNLYIIT